ncbi:peptidase E [Aliarcobacter lanthieri]|uniref:peptidase E n=1 Tax=Aliarcobacter lanthieri TaxID=1355374 RepID=UPI00047A69CA|nr:Type 1 glutamine amidotransferase-like domain-containing protein [Aliarcobacter lanthieri]QKF58643.1 peptidase E-like protein, peptidase S51 family [Aliarcobacter lanthieri]
MKKLFLSSSFSDVIDIFIDFQKDLKGKSVTFIPTASIIEEVDFYVDLAKKDFQKLGLVVNELEISTATNDEIERKLRKNDFIYISGGNTFFLLQELKRTGADKIIIEEVNKGKLYIGESAGAIITSKNIEYAKEMDSVEEAINLKNFEALNLVDFYIVPHYKNFPFEKSVEKIIEIYSSKLSLKPISNNEAILVNSDKISLKKV